MATRRPASAFRGLVPAHLDHRRIWDDLLYAYPVVSRRAGGLSVGVNLNPDKRCNFDCAYCQVDRVTPPRTRHVDVEVLRAEVASLLDAFVDGSLWRHPRFAATPGALRRLSDIAFSGDGEPTTEPRFAEAVEAVCDLKDQRGLDEAKVVLITDAACLHHERVRRGLERLDRSGGSVWAKLDAGTERHYRLVNRTSVPFGRVLKNLALAASERPIVVQSLFMRAHGELPSDAEIEAWIERLAEIERAGTIDEVHVYTLARAPAESWCTVLEDKRLEDIAGRARARLGAKVRTFYGPGGEGVAER